MKDILVIGFHTYEKFIARKRVRKIIEKALRNRELQDINIYHVAIGYNNHHYLYKNDTMIKKIKTDDFNSAYIILMNLLAKIQTEFRLITFWGHAWGASVGSPNNSKLVMSVYDFAKPILDNNINSFLLLLEGCDLGNIITLIDCYKFCRYMIGPSNGYGWNTFLNFLHIANFETEKEIVKSMKKVNKQIDPKDLYCLVIYKTKFVDRLIKFLSKVDLSKLDWNDMNNIINIKQENPNSHDFYNIVKNYPKAKKITKILDNIVVFCKCNINIDKFIYTNIYEESIRNTYYKILNKESKEFYISNPINYKIS